MANQIKYGWRYYLAPTPKNVSRWMMALKGAIATVATTAFVEGNESLAFYLLLGTGLLNELSQMFGEDPPTTPEA